MGEISIFDLFVAYVPDIMRSAGMSWAQSKRFIDRTTPFDERWDIFAAWYPHFQAHSYCQAVVIALRELYQLREVSKEEFLRISNILGNEDHSSLYRDLFARYGIEKALTFIAYDDTRAFEHHPLLTPVPSLHDIMIHSFLDIKRLEAATGMDIVYLSDVCSALDALFADYHKQGIKNIKFANGNRRVLNFQACTFEQAERTFNAIMDIRITGEHYNGVQAFPRLPDEQILTLDNYLTPYMVSLAQKYNMNVIFHISTHVWNLNSVEPCRAQHLEWLIRKFPKVRFVLLHCSMPFIDEAVLLARNFPNVYLNMTWCHIIDRLQTMELIKKCATTLPLNKIHAFGGDYSYPHTAIGHLMLAKDNLYQALCELIDRQMITQDQAYYIVRAWLYDNPVHFYW